MKRGIIFRTLLGLIVLYGMYISHSLVFFETNDLVCSNAFQAICGILGIFAWIIVVLFLLFLAIGLIGAFFDWLLDLD